jgi:hypothetical protein
MGYFSLIRDLNHLLMSFRERIRHRNICTPSKLDSRCGGVLEMWPCCLALLINKTSGRSPPFNSASDLAAATPINHARLLPRQRIVRPCRHDKERVRLLFLLSPTRPSPPLSSGAIDLLPPDTPDGPRAGGGGGGSRGRLRFTLLPEFGRGTVVSPPLPTPPSPLTHTNTLTRSRSLAGPSFICYPYIYI